MSSRSILKSLGGSRAGKQASRQARKQAGKHQEGIQSEPCPGGACCKIRHVYIDTYSHDCQARGHLYL